jgi:hypothetical protein
MKWTTMGGRGKAWHAAAALGLLLSVTAAGLAAQGDRAAAQALIAELGRDSTHRAVVADSLARAEDALERGARMRVAGDEARASEADALARQWAETGRDLLRASETETRANDLRKKALEAEAQVAKTREIVEDLIARTGRLRAQIAVTELDGGAPRTAVEVHDGQRAPSKRLARAEERTKESPVAVGDGGAAP